VSVSNPRLGFIGHRQSGPPASLWEITAPIGHP
jgi:hypothetical protein